MARFCAFRQLRRVVLVGDFLGYCSDEFGTAIRVRTHPPQGIFGKNVLAAARNSPLDHFACANPV